MSAHLAHAHSQAGTMYNFVDSCILYMKEYDYNESACRTCFARKSCREGTELLQSIPSLNREELPEFFTHERPEVREAAKERIVR